MIEIVPKEGTTLKQAVAGLELLKSWGSTKEVRDKYREAGRKRWNEASVFF